MQLYQTADGLIVHLVNYNYELTEDEIIVQKDLELELNLEALSEVEAVQMISTDFPGEQEIEFKFEDHKLSLVIPQLESWTVILID